MRDPLVDRGPRCQAARSHRVTAYSRDAPEQPVDGVTYAQGSLDQVVTDVDVVIRALTPRGDREGDLLFLEWSAESTASRHHDGVETLLVRDCETVRQTALHRAARVSYHAVAFPSAGAVASVTSSPSRRSNSPSCP